MFCTLSLKQFCLFSYLFLCFTLAKLQVQVHTCLLQQQQGWGKGDVKGRDGVAGERRLQRGRALRWLLTLRMASSTTCPPIPIPIRIPNSA